MNLRTRTAAVALLALFFASPALAEAKWKCGEWKKDPKGKCEEIRTCTRSICGTGKTIDGCRTETRTECVNPKPPKKSSVNTLPGFSTVEQGRFQRDPNTPPRRFAIPRAPLGCGRMAPLRSGN